MQRSRRIPLAIKVGIFVTLIAAGAATLMIVIGIRVTRDGIDRRYEDEAHDLVRVVARQIQRDPADYQAANRLLAEIVRTHPNVVRMRLFRASGVRDATPQLWASSYGTDLAVDAGPEVLPTPGDSIQEVVSIGGTELFLTAEPLNLPNDIKSAVVYFEAGPRRAALADTRQAILFGAVGVILVQLLAIALAIYALVLRRIKRLERAAAAVAEGNLSVQVAPRSPAFPDELTETTRQFNTMVRAIEGRTRQLAAAAAFGQAALGEVPRQELLEGTAATIATVLEVDIVSIFERTPQGLRLRAGQGWPPDADRVTLPADRGASQSGWTLETGEPVVMLDRATETRFRVSELSDSLGIVSGVTVPIGRHAPYGVLAAHQRSRRVFTRDDITFLTTMANILAETIDRELGIAREREAEERYRLVVDNTAEMITLTDAEGRIQFASPSYRRLLGFEPDAVAGTALESLAPGPEQSRLRSMLQQVTSGASVSLPDIPFLGAGDRTVWVDLTSAPVRSTDGSLRFVLHVAHDVTHRREAQEERRRLMAQLMAAQEEERQRIAVDLHDDPIQTLTAATLRLEAVRNLSSDPRQQELIARLESTISSSIQRLRHLMFELRPPALDRDGLGPALRDYLATVGREHGLQIEVQEHLQGEPDADARAIAFRIAKEAVTNAVKHADATRLDVELDGGPPGVRVTIRDDGRGFEPGSVERRHDHLGLDSMRERARVAGGWMRLDAAPGRGTVVEFFVPSQDGPALGDA